MKKDVRGHSLPTDSLDEVPLPNKHTKKKEKKRESKYIPLVHTDEFISTLTLAEEVKEVGLRTYK